MLAQRLLELRREFDFVCGGDADGTGERSARRRRRRRGQMQRGRKAAGGQGGDDLVSRLRKVHLYRQPRRALVPEESNPRETRGPCVRNGGDRVRDVRRRSRQPRHDFVRAVRNNVLRALLSNVSPEARSSRLARARLSVERWQSGEAGRCKVQRSQGGEHQHVLCQVQDDRVLLVRRQRQASEARREGARRDVQGTEGVWSCPTNIA